MRMNRNEDAMAAHMKNETLPRGFSAPPLISLSLQLLARRVRKLPAVLIQVTWNKWGEQHCLPHARYYSTPFALIRSKIFQELKPCSTINTIYIPGDPWGSDFYIYGQLFKVHSWFGFSAWPWLDCPLLRQSLSSLIEWATQVRGWRDSFWQLPVVKRLHVKYLLLK